MVSPSIHRLFQVCHIVDWSTPLVPFGTIVNQYINLITLDKLIGSKKKWESSKAKKKEKGKAKMEEVDAMGVKRARQEEPSQGKEKGESTR